MAKGLFLPPAFIKFVGKRPKENERWKVTVCQVGGPGEAWHKWEVASGDKLHEAELKEVIEKASIDGDYCPVRIRIYRKTAEGVQRTAAADRTFPPVPRPAEKSPLEQGKELLEEGQKLFPLLVNAWLNFRPHIGGITEEIGYGLGRGFERGKIETRNGVKS